MTEIITLIPIITPGTPVEGGFHGGYFPALDGTFYPLILPPKALSEVKDVTWTESEQALAAMEGCRRPNRVEGALLYARFAPHLETTPELFRTGGPEAFEEAVYWLGEECQFDSDSAWVQTGYDGIQLDYLKVYPFRCRAVRIFLI